jgi:hypothetical protein
MSGSIPSKKYGNREIIAFDNERIKAETNKMWMKKITDKICCLEERWILFRTGSPS